jgi:hypothetical protein
MPPIADGFALICGPTWASSVAPIEIDPTIIERFTRLMRERLVSGDAAARKAYLGAIIDSIVVSQKTIRITWLERSTLGPNGQPTPVVLIGVGSRRR